MRELIEVGVGGGSLSVNVNDVPFLVFEFDVRNEATSAIRVNRRPPRFRYFFSPPDITVIGSAIRTRFAVERSDELHAVDRVGILYDRFDSCVI